MRSCQTLTSLCSSLVRRRSASHAHGLLTSSARWTACGPWPDNKRAHATVSANIAKCKGAAPAKAQALMTDNLFDFTRGRFVHDEQHELAIRRVSFNVNELMQAAARAVQAERCVSITKCPDGMYNKAFVLEMDDGREVIAKVPNPNAGPPHFTTASEVATMRFLRDVLKLPLPEVYSYNTKPAESPVGAEYIIMEKVKGVELETFWPQMGPEPRAKIVQQLAGFDKTLSKTSFNKYGSLYFAEDAEADSSTFRYTDPVGEDIADSRFAIGSTVGREWFDHKHDLANVDLGPWSTLEDYHIAIGRRELACAESNHQPRSSISLRGPGLYLPPRDQKVLAIQWYLQLLKGLLPEDQTLVKPGLAHADLHESNIFVDPANPTKIVGLIDWQCTEIKPLYFRARQPFILDYEGPQIDGPERPVFPPNMSEMNPVAQAEARQLYVRQSLCAYYRQFMRRHAPEVHKCFEFQKTPNFDLLLLARNLSIDGDAVYLAHVIELEAEWDTIRTQKDMPWPIAMTVEQRKDIEFQSQGSLESMAVVHEIRDKLGELWPEDGCVQSDRYDAAIKALKEARDEVIEKYAFTEDDRREWIERSWPIGT